MNSTIGELTVVEMLNLNVTPCEGMFVSLTDCDILIVFAGHRHHLDSVYQKQVSHRGGGGDMAANDVENRIGGSLSEVCQSW